MMRDLPDFHVVLPTHIPVHDRLLNWAVVVGSSGGHSGVAPMFRNYRSTEVWAEVRAKAAPDTLDAIKIEKQVYALPEKNCMALRWSYVYFHRMGLHKACRALAVNQAGLADLINTGRTMLKNRLAQRD